MAHRFAILIGTKKIVAALVQTKKIILFFIHGKIKKFMKLRATTLIYKNTNTFYT